MIEPKLLTRDELDELERCYGDFASGPDSADAADVERLLAHIKALESPCEYTRGYRFHFEEPEQGEEREAAFEFIYRKVKYLHVNLEDVRAADGIRIHYDFERDGWAIEQGQRFVFKDHEDLDTKWKEVAFIQAWGSQDPSEVDDE